MSLSSGSRRTAHRALGVLAGFVLTVAAPVLLTPGPSRARTIAPAGVAPLPSQVAPGQTITIAPEADTYVSGSLPGTNFGTDDHFDTYGGFSTACVPHNAPAYGLLRFDLSAIPAGSLISDASIVTTTRAGFAQDGDPHHHAIFLADDSWQETGVNGVTWNTAPLRRHRRPRRLHTHDRRRCPVVAAALGADFMFRDTCLTDPAGNQVKVFPTDITGTPKSFAASTADLISRVGIERAGDGKLSIELYNPNCPSAECPARPNSAYWARYWSCEAADPAVRPFLEVTLAPSGLGLRLFPSSTAVTAAGSGAARRPLADGCTSGCDRATCSRPRSTARSCRPLDLARLPARLDPARFDPARLDPARVDPAGLDPARLDPARHRRRLDRGARTAPRSTTSRCRTSPSPRSSPSTRPACRCDPARRPRPLLDAARLDPPRLDRLCHPAARLDPARLDRARLVRRHHRAEPPRRPPPRRAGRAATSTRRNANDDAAGAEPARRPARLDPARLDPPRVDPARLDPARLDPPRLDRPRRLTARFDPARLDPARFDPARLDPARLDPARLDPARVDPARLDPARVRSRSARSPSARSRSGSIPLGSIPLGSIPLGSIPLGSIPLGLDPARLDPAGLDPARVDPARLDPARVDRAGRQLRRASTAARPR